MMTIGLICALLVSATALGIAIYFYPRYKKYLMKSHQKKNNQDYYKSANRGMNNPQDNPVLRTDNVHDIGEGESKTSINPPILDSVNRIPNIEENDPIVTLPKIPTHKITNQNDDSLELVLSTEDGGNIIVKINNKEINYKFPIEVRRNCNIEVYSELNGQKSPVRIIPIEDFISPSPTFVCDNNVVKIMSKESSEIYYTTDGSIPSNLSQRYCDKGIELTKNATILAVAMCDGKKPSKIVSYKFVYIPSTSERIRELTNIDNILGISFQGDGHIKQSTPCQDYHQFSILEHNWKLAIVSDGAGSAKLSDSGSKAVCAGFKYYIENLIKESDQLQRGEILDAPIWNLVFRSMLASFQSQLRAVAAHQKCAFKDLSATIIILLYNKNGYMAAHVGDGRGGIYSNGEWLELFTPHKGEEVNQTFFSTADFSNPSLLAHGIPVPETTTSNIPFEKFVLMSDGCENGCWTTYQRVELPNGEWKVQDVNKPRVQAIEDAFSLFEKAIEDRKSALISFIQKYNLRMESETDDKTILLGINQ